MTFPTAFTAVGSVFGILGFAVLLAATVLTAVADLTGRDLVRATDGEAAS